jgi:hypothetical protein
VRVVRTLLAIVFVAVAAAPARADLILIDANAYVAGTDLSELFLGSSLLHLTNQQNTDGMDGRELYRPTGAPVLALTNFHSPDVLSIGSFASHLDDYDACSRATLGSLFACRSYDVLELRLDNPTNFIAIDSIWFSDSPGIRAYDAAGNLLNLTGPGSLYTHVGGVLNLPNSPTASTITLNRSQADISRIVFGGEAGNSTPLRISYNVPEPATLSLVGLGLAGVGLFRKRRARRSC